MFFPAVSALDWCGNVLHVSEAEIVGLADFLFARIGEDEAAAYAVILDMSRWDNPDWAADAMQVGASLPGPRFTARWAPFRVLAECEAKRQLIDYAFRNAAVIDSEWGDCCPAEKIRAGVPGSSSCYGPDTAGELLCLLALPYVDHPDYQPGWVLDD